LYRKRRVLFLLKQMREFIHKCSDYLVTNLPYTNKFRACCRYYRLSV
jgi:hypothetical protein